MANFVLVKGLFFDSQIDRATGFRKLNRGSTELINTEQITRVSLVTSYDNGTTKTSSNNGDVYYRISFSDRTDVCIHENDLIKMGLPTFYEE